MNAQVQIANGWLAPADKVSGFHPSNVVVKGVKRKGYVLTGSRGSRGVLAFIETLGPHPRIGELLAQYSLAGTFTARELMRTLLNAEDYRSDIYDFIVRVYYAEELTNV